MNDFTERGFIDKVLDAGLKEYSRVPVPADFAVRRPQPRANWGWLLVPAAAALAMATTMTMMRPSPLPGAPQRVIAGMEVPALSKSKPMPRVFVAVTQHPHAHYRTLTAIEIARLNIPAELLATHEETPITELTIKPLESKPLESANPTESNPNEKE